jgi:hypothetical protein
LISAICNALSTELLPTLNDRLADANINTPLPEDLTTAQTLLSTARADIKTHCTTQTTSRADELTETIAQERNSFNLSLAKIL